MKTKITVTHPKVIAFAKEASDQACHEAMIEFSKNVDDDSRNVIVGVIAAYSTLESALQAMQQITKNDPDCPRLDLANARRVALCVEGLLRIRRRLLAHLNP